MKYLKLFESVKRLKKYILISSGLKLSIIEIFNSYDANIGKLYNFKTLYRIDENGVRKIPNSDSKTNDLTLRYSFIINHMIEDSNDLQELINEMEIVYNSNKYNL